MGAWVAYTQNPQAPPQLKLNGLREKHILRKSAQRLLPEAILNRTKQPYRAPDSQSFVQPDSPGYVARRLAPPDLATAGYFDPKPVERLVVKLFGGGGVASAAGPELAARRPPATESSASGHGQ